MEQGERFIRLMQIHHLGSTLEILSFVPFSRPPSQYYSWSLLYWEICTQRVRSAMMFFVLCALCANAPGPNSTLCSDSVGAFAMVFAGLSQLHPIAVTGQGPLLVCNGAFFFDARQVAQIM